jgi:hypothetical protein
MAERGLDWELDRIGAAFDELGWGMFHVLLIRSLFSKVQIRYVLK